MGRKKLGESHKIRITLPPDASPKMVALFDRFKKMKPMAAMNFLYQLSEGQTTVEEVMIDDEDDFEDMLADFMP